MQGALPACRPAGVLEEGRHDARGVAQEAEVLGLIKGQPAACVFREKGHMTHIMHMQVSILLTISLLLAKAGPVSPTPDLKSTG